MKSFKEYKVPSNYAAMMAKKRKKAGTSEFGSKSDTLSSAEYQKAKKRKSFNSKDWKWDSKEGIYRRVKK